LVIASPLEGRSQEKSTRSVTGVLGFHKDFARFDPEEISRRNKSKKVTGIANVRHMSRIPFLEHFCLPADPHRTR
jgi:hypothetical protein